MSASSTTTPGRWLCATHQTPITDPMCPECRDERRRSFGAALRKARLSAGLTLSGLGTQVRLTYSFIAKIERGEVDPPQEHYIRLMERRMELPEGYLLDRSGRIPFHVLEALRRPEVLREVRAFLDRLPPEMLPSCHARPSPEE